jgi:hypothetical protein
MTKPWTCVILSSNPGTVTAEVHHAPLGPKAAFRYLKEAVAPRVLLSVVAGSQTESGHTDQLVQVVFGEYD